MEPLIGALAAGNAVVLKPSELAPSCSAFLAETIHDYLDNSAVKVIEGSSDTGEKLLEHKFDKIFFTGSYFSQYFPTQPLCGLICLHLAKLID